MWGINSSFPIGYISADMGWDDARCVKTIDSLSRVDLVDWNESEELLRIVDFIEHDPPTNPKHAEALAKVAFGLPDSHAKLIVCNDLMAQKQKPEKYDLASEIERLGIVYRDPIETPNHYPLSPIPVDSPLSDDNGCNPSSSPSEPPPDDVTRAAELWNETAARIERPTVRLPLAKERRAKVKARLKDCGGIEGWKAALAKVEASQTMRDGFVGGGWPALAGGGF